MRKRLEISVDLDIESFEAEEIERIRESICTEFHTTFIRAVIDGVYLIRDDNGNAIGTFMITEDNSES